jgi:regulator of RNase E activity RraA
VPQIDVAPPWERAEQDSLQRFTELPSSIVGDAMERIGVCDGVIEAQWSGVHLVGTVLPIWTIAGDNAALHAALQHVQPGDVFVIDGQGLRNRALFGEMLALSGIQRGLAGVVIDGAVRDTAALAALQFPAFARGRSPAGPFKNGPGRIGYPIACGGVPCNAGDIVVADDDGVVIVARDSARAVARCADALLRTEQKKRSERSIGSATPKALRQSRHSTARPSGDTGAKHCHPSIRKLRTR